MCKSILAFPTVRATVAVHPSQGGYPVDRLLTDRVCDIRRGHVVDPFFRLRSWWGDAHHSRLSEPLDILIGEPQHLRQTAGIHAYSLQAALEKEDFDGDSQQYVVRVFVCLAEPSTRRLRPPENGGFGSLSFQTFLAFFQTDTLLKRCLIIAVPRRILPQYR